MSLIDIFLIFLKWKIQSDALKKNEFFVTFKYQMDKSLVKVNIKNMLSLGVYEKKSDQLHIDPMPFLLA